MNIETKIFKMITDILNHRYENKTLVIVAHTIGDRAYSIPIKSIRAIDGYDISDQYGFTSPIYEWWLNIKAVLKHTLFINSYCKKSLIFILSEE